MRGPAALVSKGDDGAGVAFFDEMVSHGKSPAGRVVNDNLSYTCRGRRAILINISQSFRRVFTDRPLLPIY
jgi:hypothetical protein